ADGAAGPPEAGTLSPRERDRGRGLWCRLEPAASPAVRRRRQPLSGPQRPSRKAGPVAAEATMGNCVSPQTDDASFAVWNVDDAGNRVQPGRISLTDSQLVFVQKGGEPIRWPLSGLRRYGFDAELFSFESGRRCPTGSGVYAFRCPRAERLFNLLQERIQSQAPARPPSLVDSPPSPEMRTTADYLEPISIGAQVVSSVHFVSNSAALHPPAAGGPVYQNVPVQQSQNSDTVALSPVLPGPPPPLSTPGVNYVVLDLDHSEPATPTSPTSPLSPPPAPSPPSQHSPSPLGYAQIDFDKTMALQQVANRQRSGS
ncbi:hypothetical protein BIW11_04754, partial [Tropilaelaps mercedesae]